LFQRLARSLACFSCVRLGKSQQVSQRRDSKYIDAPALGKRDRQRRFARILIRKPNRIGVLVTPIAANLG